jgi:RimJ/RimL family protein N-acetyltransferase
MSTLSTLAGGTREPEVVATPTVTVKPQPTVTRPRIIGLKSGEWVDVIPYNANLDPNAPQFLFWFWERLQKSGLLALYFPHGTEASFPQFVGMMSGGTNVILVVVKSESGEVQDTMGFATWGTMQLGLATVGCAGFVFLPEFWDAKATVEAAKRIERLWFDEMPQHLDLLVGIIAKDNVAAQRFMPRIGWSFSGSLPGAHLYAGQPSDATIWYLTRSQFESQESV